MKKISHLSYKDITTIITHNTHRSPQQTTKIVIFQKYLIEVISRSVPEIPRER